jgi:hypothetical protein
MQNGGIRSVGFRKNIAYFYSPTIRGAFSKAKRYDFLGIISFLARNNCYSSPQCLILLTDAQHNDFLRGDIFGQA